MKKGALATTALALGAGATAGTASAQDNENQIVVFAEDYHPGVDMDVVAELETETASEAVENAEIGDVVDDLDDWTGYLINYDFGGSSGSMAVLFTETADLSAGDTETMGEDGSFRDSELGLIEATVGGGGNGGNGAAAEDDMEEEEEPAADNETEDNATNGDGGDGGDGGGGGGGGGGGN